MTHKTLFTTCTNKTYKNDTVEPFHVMSSPLSVQRKMETGRHVGVQGDAAYYWQFLGKNATSSGRVVLPQIWVSYWAGSYIGSSCGELGEWSNTHIILVLLVLGMGQNTTAINDSTSAYLTRLINTCICGSPG